MEAHLTQFKVKFITVKNLFNTEVNKYIYKCAIKLCLESTV
jgi:hypothetical protein